jgi:hypothetical protein
VFSTRILGWAGEPENDLENRCQVIPDRGFESHALRSVLSQDIEDTSDLRVRGVLEFLGLVVPVRVEGEGPEEFSGEGVDDADVEVLDEHEDAGAGVCSADADVVQAAVVAEGDASGLVDGVVAQPVVAALVAVGRGGFGA